MDNLIERLRRKRPKDAFGYAKPHNPDGPEAAAELERLSAEVASIKAAGLALLAKLDAAMPHIENAVLIATNHHCPYEAEPIGEAIEAFRQALACHLQPNHASVEGGEAGSTSVEGDVCKERG